MAELNTEQALSYAENLVNWSKSRRHLEDVVKYVRDHKREIPMLADQLQKAREALDKAQGDLEAYERKVGERQANMKGDTDAASGEYEAKAELVRQLRQEVAKLQSSQQSLDQEVEKLHKLLSEKQRTVGQLSEQENSLKIRVQALKEELVRI